VEIEGQRLILGINRDITERKRFELRLHLLVEIIQQLARAQDVPSILAAVRSSARRLAAADGATFVLREGDRCHYVDEDSIAPLWKGSRFPLTACISGWSMLHDEAVAIADIGTDPRIPVEAYRSTFVKSLAMVPIRVGATSIGAIGNYWARTYTPTSEEMQLLQTLADATGIALQNVHYYTELEQRVRARTAELEAANRELEAFSYSVSHDLRAPLRTVDGFSQAVLEDYGPHLPDDARRQLGLIRAGAQSMGALIDDLLAFARLSRQPLQAREVNMNRLVADCRAELAAELAGRSVEFRIADLPDAVGDPALLKQVWLNLLANALKFSRRRSPAVIEVGSAQDQGIAVYHVRDNGTGFDMRYAPKLFGVFQRLHRAEDFEGTGVGLALVQRVVHRHGGRVWAEAAVDRGAAFYFTVRPPPLPGS
jgi:signal transduction histidine kinase